LLYCSSECGNVFHEQCMNNYTKPKSPYFSKCPLCRTVSYFLETKTTEIKTN
jgi:hypothetical protein